MLNCARCRERDVSDSDMAVGTLRAQALGVVLIASAVSGAEESSSKRDEAACAALGFAPSLLCSACDKLGEFVGSDDSLIAECRDCCTEEVTGSGGTYAQATLDVCK